jgi:cytochrome oxidase Cu insertion factor (SCO1/SenC/PrrC family)
MATEGIPDRLTRSLKWSSFGTGHHRETFADDLVADGRGGGRSGCESGGQRMSGDGHNRPRKRTTRRRAAITAWLAVALGALLVAAVGVGAVLTGSSSSAGSALGSNPNLDPGTPLSRPAPDFTLTDQFGRRVSLHSYRGKVVILAFNDSQCTTVCPLTTTAMVDAKRFLGAAGAHVQLLGIDANPDATAVSDVRSYSGVHGMLYEWRFLTAPLPQLKRVWKAYGIDVKIEQGQVDHTPALYVIDPEGRLRKLYMTQMNYASVPQLGQLLAYEAVRLLPGRPRVRSSLSFAQVPPIGPRTPVGLARAGGGTVRLAPGHPRLLLFFATWDQEVFPDLGRQLQALDRYLSAGATGRLPALTAVDEASVEPSASALPHFLHSLARSLSYPVAIDRSGRVADGYEVQDQPWFVLVSSSGRILWYYDVSTQGWLTLAELIRHVRAALAHVATVTTPSAAAVSSVLAGSPAPLADVHRQAGRLLGSESALAAQLGTLRGYPVVLNAWASWCIPCQQEFPLFASASLRYGRQVAFLGADTNDSATDAQSFLAKHAVGYPSYQTTTGQLAPLAQIEGLPTTIFINRSGKVLYVHTGQYETQGTLDEDIQRYALRS